MRKAIINIIEREQCKKILMFLSWSLLFLSILLSGQYFIVNNSDHSGKITFVFPTLYMFISLLLNLLPSILWIIYVFKFQTNINPSIIVSVITFPYLANLIKDILHNYMISNSYNFSDLILGLIYVALFLCLIKFASKGSLIKIFMIITDVLYLLSTAMLIIVSAIFIKNDSGETSYMNLILILYNMCYLSILLIISLKNNVFKKSRQNFKKDNAEKISPDECLKALKDKFELGIINEEEYRIERNQIINKL